MGHMEENAYDQLDDLFGQIRLRLGQVRQSDPVTADDIKGLIAQVELWVESLVVDSLRLKSLESKPKRTTKPANKPQRRPAKK